MNRKDYSCGTNLKVEYNRHNVNSKILNYEKIKEIIISEKVCYGEYTNLCEKIFKDRFNVKHAIFCSNATTGLAIAVRAAGWQNKKIALPAFTWPSTYYALQCTNNTPIFCDINKDTWHMELDSDYDCVLAMDTFGSQIVIETDKPVIYDAAHGFDIPLLGHRGLAEVVSFSYTKIVTGMQGGVILTNDDELANKAKDLVHMAGKIEEINLFILQHSINRYDNFYKDFRLNLIDYYEKSFNFSYKTQTCAATNKSVYSILLENSDVRNHAEADLLLVGVNTKVYYTPLILGLPNTDNIYNRILCLPVHEGAFDHKDLIINTLNQSIN